MHEQGTNNNEAADRNKLRERAQVLKNRFQQIRYQRDQPLSASRRRLDLSKISEEPQETLNPERLERLKHLRGRLQPLANPPCETHLEPPSQRTAIKPPVGQTQKTEVYLIKLFQCEPFRVTAYPSKDVQCLKKIIEIQKNYPWREQRLSYGGVELDNNRPVGEYSLPAEATLLLQIVRKVQFMVNAVANANEILNCMELSMDIQDTLEAVQFHIHKTWGIPPQTQKLFNKSQGLKNSKATLRELGIQPGVILQLKLELNLYRPVSVRNTAGEIRNLIVTQDITLISLVELAERVSPEYEYFLLFEGKKLDMKLKFFNTDVPSFEVMSVERHKIESSIQGKIRTLTGQCIQLSISKNETIGDLKRRIFDKRNYPVRLQLIKLGTSELQDQQKLADCIRSDKFELDLRLRLREPQRRP